MTSPESPHEAPMHQASSAEQREVLGPEQTLSEMRALVFDMPTAEKNLVGGVANRAKELGAQLRPMVNSLNSEQLVQALNMLANMDYYLSEPDDKFDYQGLVTDLKDRLYGSSRVREQQFEVDTFGGRDHSEDANRHLRWLGAPIELYLGNIPDDEANTFQQPRIILQQDGDGTWWHSENPGERQPVPADGCEVGVGSFDPTNKEDTLRYVSKRHLVLKPGTNDAIAITDTSTNGTRISMLSYPFE